jgi:hypothetical protein
MIIVLSAPKRSGKDVVADILKRHFNYQRVAFADPLRKLSAECMQLPLIHFTDDALKDLSFNSPVIMRIENVEILAKLVNADEMQTQLLMQHGRDKFFNTPREILQFIGTELLRNCIAEDFLVNLALDVVKKTEGHIVITDARFPNERAALKSLGATLIRIKRAGYEGSGHVSELSIGEDKDYDVIINNDDTLTRLELDVKLWHSERFKRS